MILEKQYVFTGSNSIIPPDHIYKSLFKRDKISLPRQNFEAQNSNKEEQIDLKKNLEIN